MEIRIQNIPIHYEQAGSGQPVLLLHGWGCSTELWQGVLAHLSQRFLVTAIDFPGHGKSGFPPESGWSVEDYMRLTAELIQALHLEGCTIIAHSFGARVAIKLANTHPQLVGRMVFTGGAGIRPKRGVKYYIRTYTFKALKALTYILPGGQTLRDKLRGRFGSSDYKALPASMRATFSKVVGEDLTPALAGIQAETLLIWGDNDQETPLWMGQTMEKHIKGSALIVLPGSHFVYLEQLPRFLQIVDAFLKN